MSVCENCKQQVEERIFAFMKANLDTSRDADVEMGCDPEDENSNTNHAKAQGYILYEILHWLRDDKVPTEVELANDLKA